MSTEICSHILEATDTFSITKQHYLQMNAECEGIHCCSCHSLCYEFILRLEAVCMWHSKPWSVNEWYKTMERFILECNEWDQKWCGVDNILILVAWKLVYTLILLWKTIRTLNLRRKRTTLTNLTKLIYVLWKITLIQWKIGTHTVENKSILWKTSTHTALEDKSILWKISTHTALEDTSILWKISTRSVLVARLQ